ncbi:beta strand repeat-containing protein, partial [Pedobacter sandarakinus]|uniref:beta strand repeat-containing protein n=1 Tax=Pedobacter sandarakinus TaxID=353156 RepID=UPI00224787D1
ATTDKDKVGVVQADGSVIYQTLSSANISAKDLTAEDASIAVTDGTGATLANAKVKVADGGISTQKLADAAVTNAKVGADAITTDKIKDGEVKTSDLADKNVTAEKLYAGAGVAGRLAIADATGNVTYSNAIPSGSVTGENVTAASNKVVLAGTPAGAALKAFSIDVNEANLTLSNLGGKVTNGQITTGTANQILVTNAAGTSTQWIDKSAATSVSNSSANNSLSTTVNGTLGATVNIINSNVIGLDATNKLLTSTINGVVSNALDISSAVAANQKTTTLSNGDNTTVTSTIVGNVTDFKVGVNNASATTTGAVKPGAGLTVDGTGTLAVDASAITTGRALTSTDLSVSANGATSVLKDVTIDIKNGAVTSDKILDATILGNDIANKTVGAINLASGAATAGQLATADGTGGVTYATLNVNSLGDKKTLATDGIIKVNSSNSLANALLADATLSISDESITSGKIKDGEVKNADLADKSVSAIKLDAGAGLAGRVGVADAAGLINYQTLSETNLTSTKSITGTGIGVTGGSGSTLKDVTLAINDDAITSIKIKDGEVKTADLADKNITASKLDAGAGVAGRLAIADATGNVTYSNAIPSGSVTGENVTAASNKVVLAGTPAGAALKSFSVDVNEANLTLSNLGGKVTNGQITTGTANQILVTNAAGTSTQWIDKSAATSVSNSSANNSLSTTVNGTLGATVNIINSNVVGLDATNKLLTSTINGVVSNALDISSAVAANQKTTTLSNGNNTTVTSSILGNVTDFKVGVATASGSNAGVVKQAATNPVVTINATGELGVNANNGLAVANANVQLGGSLVQPTAVATNVTNTLAITGLQAGATNDKIIVADPTTGVLKQVNATMPKWFYMPSIVLDVSSIGNGRTVNLYALYTAQFSNIPGAMNSTGATRSIPFLPTADALEYYVTYVDSAVITVTSVSATGIMTYNVIGKAKTTSFANIVFVVK